MKTLRTRLFLLLSTAVFAVASSAAACSAAGSSLPESTAPDAAAQTPAAAAAPTPSVQPGPEASPSARGQPGSVPGALPPPQTTSIPIAAAPTPSTEPPRLRRLTEGGCCSGAFWSPDSGAALYLDRPGPEQPAGIWQAAIDGGEPALLTDRLGIYSADMQLRAFPERGNTVVERLADGQRWIIPSGGRAVNFSPGGRRLAWNTGQSGVLQNAAQRTVWISRTNGSEARQATTVTGGGFAGWLTDNALLVSGRPLGSSNIQALWRLDIPEDGAALGEPVELTRAERLRNLVISPDGSWAVYLPSFTADPAQDGLWLLDTASGQRRKLEVFGAYRWRDAGRLVIIPLEPGSAAQRVIQIEAASGITTELIDPAQTTFKIANGEWSISPDGGKLLFRSAEDDNLWVLALGE